jgi:hypothetical protein
MPTVSSSNTGGRKIVHASIEIVFGVLTVKLGRPNVKLLPAQVHVHATNDKFRTLRQDKESKRHLLTVVNANVNHALRKSIGSAKNGWGQKQSIHMVTIQTKGVQNKPIVPNKC